MGLSPGSIARRSTTRRRKGSTPATLRGGARDDVYAARICVLLLLVCVARDVCPAPPSSSHEQTLNPHRRPTEWRFFFVLFLYLVRRGVSFFS
jgi:hypothetical protein